MRITTLGPLAVDGRPVRGERLAAVVRALVEARGRAVSVAALVDAVWAGAPPDDAPGAVQALMSRVRRLGLAVEAVPGGYRVPAERLEIDVVLARGLVERGRAALRAGDAVLARACGDEARELFPEVPDGSRLLADVAALRAEAALAGAGGLDEGDLRLLVARTPPDEPSAALLVRVLAAQGRDAEALDVIEHLKEDLADRYGTDLSPLVTQVHVALLRGELAQRDPSPIRQRDTRGGTPPPAPRDLGRPKALPAAWRRPATPLVGREQDVAAVVGALGAAPLVTVVATGGAGKTRLAAEVARTVAADGRTVYVVELAALRSPDAVLPALLAAIGATEAATGRPDVRDLGDRLRGAASDLDGVVLLDNCEHLLAGAADVVANLLAAATPELAVLATSRAPLSLPGEVVHRLRALPDEAALGLLEARTHAGGAVLRWHPDLALELCHRLDNLPLALELAAARLRHMPIQDVLAGLSDRFALLDDALRGLPERHASLWAMVDWSRELLAVEERDLLQRLAVIPAPFTAEAAAMVAGSPGTTTRGLATLVEQSLLTLEQGDDGAPRYRILETVREYGEVRLDAAGERDAAMAGLVRWAAAEAAGLIPDFIGTGQLVAFARCVAEQDNLVAALGWAIAHDDESAAVDVAAALFHLWSVRGLHPEVVTWAKLLLHLDDPAARRRSVTLHGSAAVHEEKVKKKPNADRITWVALYAGLNAFVGETPRLFAVANRALRTLAAERPGEISARAHALVTTLPALTSPNLEVSLAAASRMVTHPDPYVAAFGMFLRSVVRENNGELDESLDDAVLAYHGFEAAGDHWGMGMSAQSIGSRGAADADQWLRRGERHMALLGAQQDAGSIRVLLDLQLALAGDPEGARRLAEAAVSTDIQELDVVQARIGLAQVAWQQRRYDEAIAHADQAMEQLTGGPELQGPPVRVLFRAVAAILHLGVAETRDPQAFGVRAEARAVDLLAQAREEAITSLDVPVLGSWALGGAALAAYRGSLEKSRELWTLGTRVGGRVTQMFQGGYSPRLAAALGEEDGREPLIAEWRGRSAVEVTDRIRELMDALLEQRR